MQRRVYLDHAATTPVIDRAREAMAEALDAWANPSSAHGEGRRAKAYLEDCRRRIARALVWPGELVLTSGATEALAIALTRVACDRRIVASVEHPAVHRMAPDAARIPVDKDGRLELEAIAGLVAGSERPLVCVQSVNNETGAIHPMDEVARTVRQAGGLLVADCSQSAGKLALPEADIVVVAAHKLGGPPGVGALLLREPGLVEPLGGQEGGLRPGTSNLPAIAGFAAAVEADKGWFADMAGLRRRFEDRLDAAGAQIVAASQPRIATIGAYRMPGVPATAQLVHMDLLGIAVSAGSACSSGSVRPSATLAAMGWSDGDASEVLRISFGRGTSQPDVEACAAAWKALIERRRAA